MLASWVGLQNKKSNGHSSPAFCNSIKTASNCRWDQGRSWYHGSKNQGPENAPYHPTELCGKITFLFLYLFVQINTGSLYLLYCTPISMLKNMHCQPQEKKKSRSLVACFFSFLLRFTFNNEGGKRLSNAIGYQEKQLYISITFIYH